MKLLKKAAAVLLAATMSLTMLTACGGGSGVGAAANESYTMETRLIKVDGVEPTYTETEYTTTNGTWSYIERTYNTDRYASLQNIKTGERYRINPITMKAYKSTNSSVSGDKGDVSEKYTVTTTTGTWTDENGKVYTTEIITAVSSESKEVQTYYYDNGQPAFIKYEYLDDEGSQSELHKVTQYSRTANESKFDLSKYTMVTDPSELYK